MSAFHGAQTSVHIVHNWTFASSGAMAAGTGYTITSADIGKQCWRSDISAYFVLMSVGPLVWLQTSGAGSVSSLPESAVTGLVADLAATEKTANKNTANGYAGLDSGGRVALAQLPAGLAGALEYQGTWNALTNSPAILSGIGTQGFFYKVATAGTTLVDGNALWRVGDLIIFDGSVWDKVDNYEAVVSVAGRTGAIVLAYADISGLGAAAQQVTAFFCQVANNLSDVANATTARSNLSAAKSGANSDITALLGITGRILMGQGAAVSSANNLVLGTDGNQFHITGTTTINLLDTTGWTAGSSLKLIFNGNLTVKNNQAASGAFAPILLVGGLDYLTAAGYCLELSYDGTNWVDDRVGLTATPTTLSLVPVAPGGVANNIVYWDSSLYELSIKDVSVSSVLPVKRVASFNAMNGCAFVLTDNGSKGNPLHCAITTSLKSGSGVSFCLFGWTRAVAYGAQIQAWAGQINFGTRANESYMGAYFNGPSQYGIYASDGTGQYEADGSNTVASVPPYSRKNANPQAGIWDFNSVVYDVSTGKLYSYCNGVLNGTAVTGAPNNSCTTDFTLGGTANASTPWCFNGTIAMVGKVTGINSTNGPSFFRYMWNSGLGRSKEAIFNYLSVNSLNAPDCLYAFDDPTGTHGLGTDSSANGNHLTSLYTTPPYVGIGPGGSYNY